jgi:hypothetical protein
MSVETSSPQQQQQEHPLLGKWNLYYHLPHDKNWELASYKPISCHMSCAEQVVAINAAMSDSIIKYCMLFVMRDGITPMWEDPKNRNGGCFSYKIANKQVPMVWKSLLLSLVGETLTVDPKYAPLLNGITISPKKNFCIVKIWLVDCSVQDPGIIINIPNLSKQGCLFKKHAPEF